MNKKFLEYFMEKFSINVKTIQWFLDSSRKTIYNYRQMDYDELPDKVWHKFFNFFLGYNDLQKIKSFDELYSIINSMVKEEIIDCRKRFNENALTRYAMRESDYISAFTTPSEGIKITTENDLDKLKKYEDIISSEKKKMSSSDRGKYLENDKRANHLNSNSTITDNISKNTKSKKTISLPENVTEGFVQALEEILNKILKNGNEYELFNYLSKYMKGVE